MISSPKFVTVDLTSLDGNEVIDLSLEKRDKYDDSTDDGCDYEY